MNSKLSKLGFYQMSILVIGFAWLCVIAFPPVAMAQVNGYRSIQIGYAIVTPTTPGSSDLIVFETLGTPRDDGSMQSGALSTGMTSEAILLVNAGVNPLGELAVAIANPGPMDALVSLTLRGEHGTVIGTKGMMILSRQQRSRFLAEMFPEGAGLPADLPATLHMASSVPVSISGLRYQNWRFSPLPVTNLGEPNPVPILEPGIGGSESIIVPYFAVGEGWDTGLFIANFESTPVTIRVDLYRQNGLPMMVSWDLESSEPLPELTIPPGGVLLLTPATAYSSPIHATWRR